LKGTNKLFNKNDKTNYIELLNKKRTHKDISKEVQSQNDDKNIFKFEN